MYDVYEFEKYLTDMENIKKTIEKYGVAICPILDNYECEEMINNKWNLLEYLTKDFEIPIDRYNKNTYNQILELFPNHKMLLQHWKVGHSELVWKVRQNPKVKQAFSKIWNTDDLIVSFDGVSIYILDKPTRIQNSWFHVDQSYTRNNFECIQSWINAYDTNEGDATLVILENSNNFHKEFKEKFDITDKKDWFKLQNKEQYEFYINNNCLEKKIKCPKGFGVFWDSRTLHYGNPVDKTSPDNFNFRCVVYICMTPRILANQKELDKRKKAFNDLRMISHWPHKVRLLSKYPQTYGKKIKNIKDITFDIVSNYISENGLKLI
tara:strand:- start:5299 stop:6264 length:966 start_codon:yes stop_codon:yes gene_type:complete